MNYFVGVAKPAFAADAYAIRGYPTIMLVDPDGKIESVSARGMVNDDKQIAPLAAKAGPRKLDRAVDKAVAKAGAAFDGQEYGKAFSEAEKVIADAKASETAKADANYVKEMVGKVEATAKSRVERAETDKEYFELQKLVDGYKKTFKGHSFESTLKEKDKLIKSKEVQKEIKALTAFEDLKKRYNDAKGPAQDAVKTEIQAFIKKNAGTKAAEKATALIG
jgi:hypothetical protein